ncbi:HAD-IA family hydrolase [bacterium]|nr:HAD-IA family hydrolase [bacterium]
MIIRRTRRIRAFIFDIGGVLVQVDSSRTIHKLSKKLAVSEAQIREAIPVSLFNEYEKGHLNANQFYENLLLNCNSSKDMDLDTFKEYWQDVLFPKDDVIGFYKAVTEDFPAWLCSNTNDMHYDLLIKDFPFMQWGRGGTYSFMVGCMKPDREIYEQAIKKSGFRPEEILFIDDLEANILAGRDHGLNTILFRDVDTLSEELGMRFPELEYLA